MTKQTPTPGADTGLPDAPASKILDAQDELATARDLVELIGMTCRHDPNEDGKAISAGVAAALARLDRGRELIEEWKEAKQ